MNSARICFYLSIVFPSTLQLCFEESTESLIRTVRAKGLTANNITSGGPCNYNKNIVTTNCVDAEWNSSAPKLRSCLQISQQYNLSACPPGFEKISKSNNDYCYQVRGASAWDYPCLKSGGASVITDLSDEDANALLNSLRNKNISRFFWLPAKRAKFLRQVQWYIPGPKWGHFLESNNIIKIHTSLLKTCLLLDIEHRVLTTESCTEVYPNLCFYINDINYPAKCPDGYHSVRYMPNEGICLGIEHSSTNLSYNAFIDNNLCKTPMGNKDSMDLTRFIFKKIAFINNLPDNMWCWFGSSYPENEEINNSPNASLHEVYVSINNIGTLSLTTADSMLLPCMACQTEVIYEKTELIFEYSKEENIMYLTIYSPAGLWKYSDKDRGIQCFSDAKGFVKVIDSNELIDVQQDNFEPTPDLENFDKIVYAINLITDRAAQYWCEGHTKDFSLIKTAKIVVNPQGDNVHVFSLVIKVHISTEDIQNMLETVKNELSLNITNIFNANKVLLMEYLEYSLDYLMVLLHMDIAINDVYEDHANNILRTYNILSDVAKTELPKYNYILINISSSMYCLPTTSLDNTLTLNWEMTSIGHIAAPRQFCLQENGLPVRRLCGGSYLLGSIWGNVEGNCNQNYKPSHTTTFLYNFVKGQVSFKNASRFLTDGLGCVLSDVDILIPADIYYLSMSLQHFVNIAQENKTCMDLGSIEHIAWVMDRVTLLDNHYLQLAQTLNSTNIILDSVNRIIDILAYKITETVPISRSIGEIYSSDYQLAIQPQYIIQISYPSQNNISGLAVINKSTNNKNFMDILIKPLFKNTTLEEVLSINNLEVATWLPDKVLNSLKRIGNESDDGDIRSHDLHIIMSVFHNDAIFQEVNINKYKVNSRIIGVSIPGYIANFKKPMPLVYKDLNTPTHEKTCGYWDFQTNAITNVPGYWSNSGCYLKKSVFNLTVCECYHLTHFGNLLDIGRNRNFSRIRDKEKHGKSLNIITLVGSFLSLLGITGIWITASVFQVWRKKAGTKVLLHLSASIALPLIFMVIFNLDDSIIGKDDQGFPTLSSHQSIACITLGALLHYSVLACFMWMLITGVLQFIRYVRVLGVYRPSRFMVKFTLIGWGTPVIPVAVVLILDKDNYITQLVSKESKYSICYPNGFYMIVSVFIPIILILVINVTLFILVLCAISKGPDGKLRSADVDLIGAQLRLSIFLFFLLGLTWIFGIFSFSSNLIWSYLFCLTSTLQGFVLFVYFIICDSQTRNLWVTLMKPQFRINSSRESITSLSSN